jgi:hypothetical protein
MGQSYLPKAEGGRRLAGGLARRLPGAAWTIELCRFHFGPYNTPKSAAPAASNSHNPDISCWTDSMAKRSPYQQRVIRDYYRNQDAILLQRLGDLVTELYLAEGKSRARLWKRAAATLEKLDVPESQFRHVVQSENPTLLANLLRQLLDKKQPLDRRHKGG